MHWFADHVVQGTVSRGWEECCFWDLKIDPVSTELFTPETVPALCENEGESVAQLTQKEHSVFCDGVCKMAAASANSLLQCRDSDGAVLMQHDYVL